MTKSYVTAQARPDDKGFWPTAEYRLGKNALGNTTLERLWVKMEWPATLVWPPQREKGEETLVEEWRAT